MAKATHLQFMGNQIAVLFDDGSKKIAYPTGGDIFYISASGSGPGPGSGDFVQPFSWDTVSSEYGPRNVTRFHEGIDFGGGAVGGVGTPIKVAGDGIVEVRGTDLGSAFGNMIIVDHGLMPNGTYEGKRVKTLYAHMVDPSPLSEGDPTVAGVTVAGGVGNTGTASQGAHLHWEVHVMNDGSGIVHNLNDDGGFRTAVNPRDFIAEYGA